MTHTSADDNRTTEDEDAPEDGALDPGRLHRDLELIKRMVAQSRRVRARSGDIYLVVGVLLVIAGIVDTLIPGGSGWVAWPVAGVLGWIYAVISGIRRGGPEGHVSYAPRVEALAWTIACVGMACAFFLAFTGGLITPMSMMPIIALLLATPLAVSGALYRYWPLTAGGVLFLVYALTCAWLPHDAFAPGFVVTMLLGYVVPGVGMLRLASDSAGDGQ